MQYVCLCVCVYKAINYIHMIMNLYIELSKFATFWNNSSMGVALVMESVVKETNLIKLYMVIPYKSLASLKGWF